VSFDIAAFIDQAGERYANFLNILRSQVDVVMRRGPTDQQLRDEAVAVASGAARQWAGYEQGLLNEAAMGVALHAWQQAHEDMELPIPTALEDHLAFIFESVAYITRLLAAQADRDVVAMAQLIRNNAMRVDLNMRAGQTASQAASAVLAEDNSNPAFRFTDRTGRNYKSSKHIRDVVRQSLVNIYNEVYMTAAFEHGHDTVQITHPDQNYKWFGKDVAIVSGRDLPTFYEIRDEVFHPSTEARVTLQA
jgi:hypothetical protein